MLNNGYGEDEKNKCQIIQHEGQWIVWYEAHEGEGGVMEWFFDSFEEVIKWHKDEFHFWENPNVSIYLNPREGELLFCDSTRSFCDNDGDVRDVVISSEEGYTEHNRSAGWAARNEYKLMK